MTRGTGGTTRAVWALVLLAAVGTLTLAPTLARALARTLDIYFIDVEGGQSTLIVTPSGESLLIDTGFPGDGTFASKPGNPAQARDPQRILAAARDAGITRIDYLLLTHFHADHDGGVVELAQLLPIGTFIDHAPPFAAAEVGVPGTLAMYDAYAALRATGRHLQPAVGDRLPLKGVEVTVVASEGKTLRTPLAPAGAANSACVGTGVPAQDSIENTRSTGVRLSYGQFRFLDVGDLSGAPLFALTCPRNLVGEADVYLVAHHGGSDASDSATYRAVNPRVAIVNNGARKGGAAETLATLARFASIDTWQLHRSEAPGAENVADARLANRDETTHAWIKLSAQDDGSFTVTNGRTGAVTRYPRRK